MQTKNLILMLTLAAALPLNAAADEEGRGADLDGRAFFDLPAMRVAQLSPEERARLRERWRETPVEERERLRNEFTERMRERAPKGAEPRWQQRDRRGDEGYGYGQGFEQRQWEREPSGGVESPGGRSGGGRGPSRGGGRR